MLTILCVTAVAGSNLYQSNNINKCLACSNKNLYPALKYKVQGAFINVDGKKIWVEQYGKGKPAVILLNGGGDSIREWNNIIPVIAKYTSIIAYDRQGLGRSAIINLKPRTSKTVIHRLQIILKQIHANPPYILVAHSIGGLYASYFARKYPNQVAGIVTLDGNNQYEIDWNKIDSRLLTKKEEILAKKLMAHPTHLLHVQAKANILLNKKRLNLVQKAKLVEYLEIMGKPQSTKEIEEAGVLPQVPLIAITESADKKSVEANLWRAAMKAFSDKIKCSRFMPIANSGHYSMIDQPKVINAAILTVLRATRAGKTLCGTSSIKRSIDYP